MTSFLDIANYGKPASNQSTPGQSGIDVNTPSTPTPDFVRSVRAAKADAVRQKKLAKAMTMGSEETVRTIATAAEEGNRLANERAVQDLRTMNYLQLYNDPKYGPEVAENRQRYFDQVDQIRQDKETDQSLGDFGLGFVGGAANFAGSLINFGAGAAEGVDRGYVEGVNLMGRALGSEEDILRPVKDDSLSVLISEGLSELDRFLDDFKTAPTLRNEQQYAIEQELDQADSAAQYAEDIAAGDSKLAAGLKQFGRDSLNTAANVVDNPVMAQQVATDAGSSLLPMVGLARGAGYAASLSKLMSQGMARKEAKDFLKTEAGQKLLAEEGAKAVPAISGAVGGGASVTQAQQEALNISDDELKKHEDYQDMKEAGLDHGEMRHRIAVDTALPALAIGTTAGALTGLIAPKFEADPLGAARSKGVLGSSVATAAINTGKETIEEGIQGASEQVAANVGLKVAGIDRDVTEGLAEAATLEAIGGGIVGGAVQAPGAALGTLKETGSLAVGGAKKAAEMRSDSIARKDDASSPVGSKVQEEKAVESRVAAEALTQVTPEQSEADQVIAQTIKEASFMADEDAAQMSQYNETLQKAYQENGQKLDRHTVVNELAKDMLSRNIPEEQKIGLAMGIMEEVEKSQVNDSDAINSAIEALPEDSPKRAELEKVREASAVLMQSKAVQEARSRIEALTSEDVSKILDVENVLQGDTESPEARSTIEAMELIGRYNPTAIDLEKYDLVLNQVRGGMGRNSILAKSLETTRSLVAEMQAADERKKEIEQAQEELVESLSDEQRKKGHQKYHARSEVRKDILERGNSYTDGKSLLQHREAFESARMAGKVSEAREALTELGNFAKSQIEKIKAYNLSAENGLGREGRVPFEAYNAKLGKFFKNEENLVWVDPSSSMSVATAMDAHVDTSMLVNLHNTLAQNYGDQIGAVDLLEVPQLHEKIRFTKPVEQITPEQTEPVDVVESPEAETSPEVIEPFEEPVALDLETPDPVQEVTVPEVQDVPEIEAEPVPEVIEEQAKPKTLAESLPNLITDADGRNRFLEAFERRPDGSKALDMESPVREVTDRVDEIAADEGNELKPVAPETKQVLGEVAETHIPKLVQAFRDRLAPRKKDLSKQELKLSKKVQRWLGELEVAGKKTLSYKDALPLNFLSKEEDGSYQVEPRIMEAASMAAVEAMVELSQRNVPNLDDEEIRDRLGLAPDAKVTQAMRNVVMAGTNIQALIDTLDRKTQALLGITPNQNTPQNLTQGLFRAMGANMIEIMEENGWIEVNDGYYKVGDDPRQYMTVKAGPDLDAKRIIEGLRGQPDIYSRALVPGHQKTRHVGKPPRRVAESQKNNHFAELSQDEQKAMDRLQRTPFRMNMPVLNELMELGEDVVFSLFGGREVDPKTTNKLNAESIEGRNQSIRSGWDGVMGYYTEALQSIGQEPDAPASPSIPSAEAAEIMNGKGTGNTYVEMSSEQETMLREAIVDIDDATGLNLSDQIQGVSVIKGRGYIGRAEWSEGILSLSTTVLNNIYDRPGAMRVLMHELGHMFDAAEGELQSRTDKRLSSKENGDLYQEIIGLVKQDAAWKKYFSYALNFSNDTEKTSELFAELFAAVMMNPEKLKELLPNGTKYIQELIEARDAAVPGLSDRGTLGRVSGRSTTTRAGEQLTDGSTEGQTESPQDVGSVPIFFEWFVSSTGRLFQKGPVTPQANKIARILMTATNGTLNLTEEQDQKRLWLSVAQALDISIDKKDHDKAINEAKELTKSISGYAPVIGILEGHLRGEEITDEDRTNLVDFMLNARNEDGEVMESTPVAFHALMTVARANLALRDGTAEAFETSLSLEADGVTDGPINAMVHMRAGAFDEAQVKILAKGGWYFSDEQMTRNDYVAQDNQDLYHEAAALLREKLDAILNDNPKVEVLRLLNMLEAFSNDFGMVEDEKTGQIQTEIGRNITKNPLTTFLYGAGPKGITQKIVDGVLGEFYSLMTDIAQQQAEGTIKSWRDHPKFAGNEALVEDMAESLGMTVVQLARVMDDPVNAEIPAWAERKMLGKLQDSFGDPLVDAIDEATGGLKTAMEFTQKASNMQAIIFQDTFKRLAAEKHSELGLEKAEILPQETMQEVFREAMKVAPIYHTDAQSFHISGQEGYDGDQRIAASLNDRVSSGPTLPKAGKAGVKVSPYMTIGTGDGRMILNIYVDADGNLDTSLPVFDGVELALDRVEDGSRQVNEGVFKGWTQGNIYRSMQESMDATLLNFDESKLSDEAKAELKRFLPKGKSFSRGVLEGMRNELGRMADENQARKEAMASLKSWVDHMAGAKSPSEHDGEAISHAGSYDAVAVSQRLNELYHEKLAQIRSNRTEAKKAPAVQKPDATIQALLDIAGEPAGEGVTKLTGQKIYAFIREQTGFSKDQNKLFWEVLAKDPKINQAQFFFGSPKDLEAYRDQKLPGMPKAPLEAGQHWVGGNVSLIANVTPETLLHEMLHAHTARTLVDYYSDPEAASPHVRDAVTRLEGLIGDFEALNLASESKGVQQAVATLKSEMRGLSDNPAARMSEFLSWTLSNQNLINLTKKAKTYSPLQKIGRKTLHLLKRMLGITTEARSDLFSKIRFNAEVLGAEPVREGKTKAETDYILNQAYGQDPRLEGIEHRFMDRLQKDLLRGRKAGDPAADQRQALKKAELEEQATQAAENVIAQGFFLNPREREAFRAVHMAMMSGMKLNPAAMRQANRAYRHAVRTLKVEDFQEEPGKVDPHQDTLANLQFEMVTGKAGLRQMANGRTDLLATFMALSLVSPEMRNVVEKLDPPKDVDGFNGTFDGLLEGTANTVINYLTRASISPRGMGSNMRQQLDVLGMALSEAEGQNRLLATEQKLMKRMDVINDYASDKLQDVSLKVSDYLNEKAEKSQNRVGVVGYTAASIVTALGSKEASTARGKGFTEMLNRANGFHELTALLSDLRGMDESTAPLLRMINRVKSKIDAMRQNYRENIPMILADHFERKVKKEEWRRMFQGIGQIDLSSIGIEDAMRLTANPADAQFYINAEIDRIREIDAKNVSLYEKKADDLANWLAKRQVTTNNLLKNADAIAQLFNEKSKGQITVTDELVAAIDRLVSLKAFEKLDEVTKETLKDLSENDTEGLRTIMTYHETTRRMEDLKAPTGDAADIARFNRWKGFIPSATPPGHATVVEDDSKKVEMERKGFVRIGDYQGDRLEGFKGKRGIYRSSVGGKNTFRQGVAQTVHESYHGIDVRTGRTQTGEMAGIIYGKAARAIAGRRRASQSGMPPGEYLIPVFDADGSVRAYERPLGTETLETMQRDRNMARMLGAWSGRVLEERAANRFNREFVETMKEVMENEYQAKGRTRADKEFVNIADPNTKDPVIRDAWETMGWRIKADAVEIFGRDNYFPVRKDMIKDAIGYRAASVTDPFTGVTRLNDTARDAMMNTAEFIMGKNAFRWMKNAENFLQTGVSYAKETIIIRSVIVPFGNFISNVLHLMLKGVGPMTIATAMRDKFLETQQYVKNQEEILRLNVELSADPDNKRLQRELASLEDVNANLSIAPLIEAGEFSTISENLTAEDVAMREGGLADWIEAAVEKLPGSLQTAGKNLLITKDTALYRGLNRSVQYGDFIAKAVLYDHMAEKGVDQREILDTLAEEFVNYNRLAGRGRDFLESIGLLWFFNYKLRIQKVMINTMRERPVSFGLFAGGVGPWLDVDTILSGSGFGAWWDNRIGYAVGPEMGLDAPSLNPWYQLLD